mmetsp:Transcript_95789/g.270818  ORF Transcript_95789/g.270818 Transcript_95789/m.270818 type:complete len:216 (-) Transcript_95789:197-844(-)
MHASNWILRGSSYLHSLPTSAMMRASSWRSRLPTMGRGQTPRAGDATAAQLRSWSTSGRLLPPMSSSAGMQGGMVAGTSRLARWLSALGSCPSGGLTGWVTEAASRSRPGACFRCSLRFLCWPAYRACSGPGAQCYLCAIGPRELPVAAAAGRATGSWAMPVASGKARATLMSRMESGASVRSTSPAAPIRPTQSMTMTPAGTMPSLRLSRKQRK